MALESPLVASLENHVAVYPLPASGSSPEPTKLSPSSMACPLSLSAAHPAKKKGLFALLFVAAVGALTMDEEVRVLVCVCLCVCVCVCWGVGG